MSSDLIRLFHTVRYLKPVQVYGRVLFRLKSSKPDLQQAPKQAELSSVWHSPVEKLKSVVAPGRFRFLNEEHELRNPSDWNNPEWGKLWLYNLHYFDDLIAENAEDRKSWHGDLINLWITDNPVGQGNGWEPYPSSLRIVNWIKWSLSGNQLSDMAVQSLAVQIRSLSQRLEYHLLGNHLFANAKALIFAGLFFEGEEAQGWLRKGLKILERELPEQVLADGGHFERSPMYHAIILEDLLDLINILQTFGQKIPDSWYDTAQRMLTWLDVMQHPDKQIPLLNDAAFEIAAKPGELIAYAARLDIYADNNSNKDLVHLNDTGFICFQKEPVTAFLDVAPIGPDYLPGHAHADTLSFEISLFGQRVIVDSGTSCYGTGEERLRQRSTAAHNTVTIDGENSSEVWGGFRVARRARPEGLVIHEGDNQTSIVCSHTGYRRLPGRPTHQREWIFVEDGLKVIDRILGDFSIATGRFYLHPEVEVVQAGNKREGSLVLNDGHLATWKIENGTVRVIDSTWHPEFGVSVPGKCLEIKFDEAVVTATFSWA